MAPSAFNNTSPSGSLDNTVRPFTTGTTEHEDQIATLVLFNQGLVQNPQVVDTPVEYLSDLTASVTNLISNASSINHGFPEVPAGGKIPVLKLSNNPNDFYYGVFNNFSVTGLTEQHDQIVKVHMNFSATWNAFFFGESPSVYQFRGMFLDTPEYPYYQEFMVAYDKFLSGKKAVENKMQTKLIISGQIIDGYLLNVAVTHDSMFQQLKQFTFTMLVKGSQWIRTNLVTTGINIGQSQKRIMEFNGLSNVNRMQQQFNMGLVDNTVQGDTSGKTSTAAATQTADAASPAVAATTVAPAAVMPPAPATPTPAQVPSNTTPTTTQAAGSGNSSSTPTPATASNATTPATTAAPAVPAPAPNPASPQEQAAASNLKVQQATQDALKDQADNAVAPPPVPNYDTPPPVGKPTVPDPAAQQAAVTDWREKYKNYHGHYPEVVGVDAKVSYEAGITPT